MIYINQVMQSMKDSTRLRVIEVEEDYVYIVNIDTTSAMPKRELYANMELDIEQNELLIIGDPYARAVPDSDLTQVQKDKRDYDWAIVEKFIIPNMSSLLRKKGREAKIVQIVADSGLGKTKVKKLLSRYWQRGMNKNSMLPDYANAGGRGKSKKLNVDKIGRPRKLTVNGEYRSDINITEEIKLQFEHGINKYYRKANRYSLKDVYHFFLCTLFNYQHTI